MEDAARPGDDEFRALACSEGGATVLERRSTQAPGPGEVLVSLRVCGLCGTDVFKLAAADQPPGTVLGHEVVAVVEGEVREEVINFSTVIIQVLLFRPLMSS